MTLENVRDKNSNLLKKYIGDTERSYRQTIIKQLLKDDYCFFKFTVDEAYNILSDLEYNEKELKDIYIELVSYNNF